MKLYKVTLHAHDDVIFTEDDKFVLKSTLIESLKEHEARLGDWNINENKVEFLLWSHKIPKDVVTAIRSTIAQKYKSIHQNCRRLWKASYYIES